MEDLKKEKEHSFWSGILTGALVMGVLLTLISACVIYAQSRYYVALGGSPSIVGSSSSDSKLSDDGLINNDVVKKTNEILSKVDKYFYFEDNVDEDKMREKIYAAIMDSLDDPYTVYYTPEEFDDLMTESEGIYYGIGSYVQIDETTSLPLLTQVFPGSPAEKAGLRNGDKVYAADGTELAGLTLNDAVALIKGPQNTPVMLTIIREGESDMLEIEVIRDKVETPTVLSEMKEDSIGYIQITEFDDVTYSQFKEAYEDLQKQGMKGLVLDLRNNPGGNLDTVVDICGEILPAGVITYTVDKYGNRDDYKGKGKNVIDVPMAVLVNEYSASAAELMTGAIRDYQKGTIIGTTTFGKGIVQSVLTLKDGSGIKLTTSSYFTPNGECIHKVGITPDIEIEFDSELYYGEQAIDNQLECALEHIKGQIK